MLQVQNKGAVAPGRSGNVSLVFSSTVLTHMGLTLWASFTLSTSCNLLVQIRFMHLLIFPAYAPPSLCDWMA